MREHILQQVHIPTDVSTVYNKYIYLLMRQHSLEQIHILTDSSTVNNKTIHLLMRQLLVVDYGRISKDMYLL
jgi:hypothetical protein